MHHHALVSLEIDDVSTEDRTVSKNQDVKDVGAICREPLRKQTEEKTETQGQRDGDLSVENMIRQKSNGDLEENHDKTEGNSCAGPKKERRVVDLHLDVPRFLVLADKWTLLISAHTVLSRVKFPLTTSAFPIFICERFKTNLSIWPFGAQILRKSSASISLRTSFHSEQL